MTDDSLKELRARGICRLSLSETQWEDLRETRGGGTRFSMTFAHAIAKNARRNQLALVDIEGASLHFGLVKSVAAVSTLDSRVVFDLVRPAHPATFDALLKRVTAASLKGAVTKFKAEAGSLQAISDKLGEALFDIVSAQPQNAPALTRILAHIRRPKRFFNARALQQDAVSLAVKAFGGDGAAVALSLPGDDTALATVRVQEDALIEHDARWIPGWRLVDSDLTGRATFTRHRDTLEVFTANKRPLEQLFGVDLIYFNQRRGSLVMVQYKMMDPHTRVHDDDDEVLDEDGNDARTWTVPIDAQFKSELARMARFDKNLSPQGPYRLNSGAFYIKLVKRGAPTNTAGIMLSLGHLDQLIGSNSLTGPQGGLRITYKALDGHYLRADGFVGLVHSGYIGTHAATTKHMLTLVDAALTGGRAVVGAIQSGLDDATTSVDRVT